MVLSGIGRQPDRDQSDQQNANPADRDQLALAGVAAQVDPVEILGQRARRDQQLGRDRAHDRGQQRGKQESGDERVEQDVRQQDEDRLRVVERDPGADHVHRSDQPGCERSDQRHSHPRHSDVAHGGHVADRAHRHESDDDVRLAEIAQAPGERRDDPEARHSRKHVECARIGGLERSGDLPVEVREGDDGQKHQRHEHDRPWTKSVRLTARKPPNKV
jgi:hypothetical protein